jgi:hypothetical protein
VGERERFVATALVMIILVVWGGGIFHVSPRFAGSALGGALAVIGSLLMLGPLAYLVIKRVKPIKAAVTRHVKMRTLLAWHIYAGLLGPLLVLLHTGHKFESVLGILLTALTLIVVFSGFVGRYLLRQIGADVRRKRGLLSRLYEAYDAASERLTMEPERRALIHPLRSALSRAFLTESAATDVPGAMDVGSPIAVARLVGSIADVESAIKARETFKRWFSRWLRFHIVLATAMYLLLVLHVWAGIHFGLRWF